MRSIDRRIARLEGGRSELVIQPLALMEDLSIAGDVPEDRSITALRATGPDGLMHLIRRQPRETLADLRMRGAVAIGRRQLPGSLPYLAEPVR
jgi:hypothetical protein